MLLFCFHYDPATGKYGAVAMNMVRFAGAAFALIGGVFLLIVFRRDFRADEEILHGGGSDRSQMGKLPLFPEQASTFAPEVDHLLYFLLAVAVFFTVLIFAAIFVLRDPVPAALGAGAAARAAHGGMALEIVWRVIPFGLTMVMFTWGASIFFRESRPPDERDADLRGRQAVDVEGAAHGGAARDQRAARPDGPAGQADHDVRRRDPQLLRAGVPHQAGRGAGPLSASCGSSRPSPASIICSARSIAARSTPA